MLFVACSMFIFLPFFPIKSSASIELICIIKCLANMFFFSRLLLFQMAYLLAYIGIIAQHNLTCVMPFLLEFSICMPQEIE